MTGRVTIAEAAAWLKLDCQTLRLMIREGLTPWAVCFKKPGSSQFTYIIYSEQFRQATGYVGGDVT